MSIDVFMHCMIVFFLASTLLFLAHKALGFVWKIDLSHQLTIADNPAVTLFTLGKLVSQIVVLCGLVQGVSTGLLEDLTYISSRFAIIFSFIVLGSAAVFKLCWFKGQCVKKSIEGRNSALGIVSAAVFLSFALAYMAKSRIYNDNLLALCIQLSFATIGIFATNAFVFLCLKKRYLQHIQLGNNAVALDAFGIILSSSLIWLAFAGSFDSREVVFSWTQFLPLLFGVFALLSTRLIFEFVWTPSSKMSSELVDDKNWSLALLSSFLQVGVIVLFVLSLI